MKSTSKSQGSSKSLEELILEGINITRNAQEGDALYSSNKFIAVDVHQRYNLWVMDAKDLFRSCKYNHTKSPYYWIVEKFNLAGSVPFLKGGPEYGDPSSEKSQILLRNIREETTQKLEWLSELRKALTNKLPSKSQREIMSPSWLSENLKWEDIIIEFKNGEDAVVTIGSESHNVSYKDLGCQDQRKLKPDTQWIFLRVLAENNGEVSWGDSHAHDQGKKVKQLLSDRLKAYFRLSDDPFYDYRKEKAYRIKMTLIPESR